MRSNERGLIDSLPNSRFREINSVPHASQFRRRSAHASILLQSRGLFIGPSCNRSASTNAGLATALNSIGEFQRSSQASMKPRNSCACIRRFQRGRGLSPRKAFEWFRRADPELGLNEAAESDRLVFNATQRYVASMRPRFTERGNGAFFCALGPEPARFNEAALR